MGHVDSNILRRFLYLPPEALAWARFEDDEASWQHDPWSVLREAAETGELCARICGTSILAGADRAGFSEIIFE